MGKEENGKRKCRCVLCGADNSGDMENILRIDSCKICLIDIRKQGTFTSHGWESWRAMVKVHGKEAMKKFYADHGDEDEGPEPGTAWS